MMACLVDCITEMHRTFITQCQLFTTGEKKPFESIVGKGEDAGNQHFLLLLQFSLPN